MLKALYHDNVVVLKICGVEFEGFTVNSGIRQGCPASGSLFAIGLDPFVRFLLSKLPRPVAYIWALADDMAALLTILKEQLPAVINAFELLVLATCMKVHSGKTQLVPIGKHSVQGVRDWLASVRPAWEQCIIGDSLQYLGAKIGPGAHTSFWDTTGSKYNRAVQGLASLSLPWSSTLRWYGVAVQGICAHLGSLRAPSPLIVQLERQAISSIAAIPHQSIPLSSWTFLQLLGGKFNFHTMDQISTAARYRVS